MMKNLSARACLEPRVASEIIFFCSCLVYILLENEHKMLFLYSPIPAGCYTLWLGKVGAVLQQTVRTRASPPHPKEGTQAVAAAKK